MKYFRSYRHTKYHTVIYQYTNSDAELGMMINAIDSQIQIFIAVLSRTEINVNLTTACPVQQ